MARIMVGYELGGGFGHVNRLMGVVRGLEKRGHQVEFFMRNIREASVLMAAENRRLLPVPDMLMRLQHQPKGARMGAYSDIMGHAGFYTPEMLYTAAMSWQTLLDHAKPDLIVCDHSPVCCLVAWGRVPVVQVADGFTMPPVEADNFPLFSPKHSYMVPPERLLKNMQEVQKRRGAWVPDCVTEPFRTAGRLVCTLPELDPYRRLRKDRVLGPAEGLLEPMPLPEKPHFFAYLNLEHKETKPILRALRAMDLPGEVVCRGMDEAVMRSLRRPGLTPHARPQPIREVMARASVVIHHGGNGTCCAALSAGRLQVTAPTHTEARMNGNAVQALGCGKVISGKEIEQAVAPALEALLETPEPAGKAQAIAADLAKRGPFTAGPQILDACEQILRGC